MRVKPSEAVLENESRASATRAPASSSLAPTPCPPGTQHATTPKPVDVKLVNDKDSATESHTRTATMNSATTLPAASAPASATDCTRDDTDWIRYTWADEKIIDSASRSDTTMPTVVIPSSSCRENACAILRGTLIAKLLSKPQGQALAGCPQPTRAASPARNGPSPSTAHRRPSYRAARRPRPKTAAA